MTDEQLLDELVEAVVDEAMLRMNPRLIETAEGALNRLHDTFGEPKIVAIQERLEELAIVDAFNLEALSLFFVGLERGVRLADERANEVNRESKAYV